MQKCPVACKVLVKGYHEEVPGYQSSFRKTHLCREFPTCAGKKCLHISFCFICMCLRLAFLCYPLWRCSRAWLKEISFILKKVVKITF